MPFEKFIPSKKDVSGKNAPEAKMLKSGHISLNITAYEKYLKGATHVELYYDSITKKIGLIGKKYGTKAAFKLRSVGKGKSTYRVNANPLIEHYGLRVTAKTTLKIMWNAQESMLELSF
ncbi:MAG: hypothetical protein KAU50_03220 [Candidatus Marinimicrobia bacterium]|nr:hypothetical protein [Candidatus Neomarinimicrobiota bacterium]